MKKNRMIPALALSLLLLAGCGQSETQLQPIGAEEAARLAFTASGLRETAVGETEVELDQRDGKQYYEVELQADGREYHYEIDALSGVIIDAKVPQVEAVQTDVVDTATSATETAPVSADTQPETAPAPQTASSAEVPTAPADIPAPESIISSDEAKEIALAQVPGASASDIVEFEIDRDDGRTEYEGKILYNGMEYEFEIDAHSCAIRSWEAEHADHDGYDDHWYDDHDDHDDHWDDHD